VSNTAIDVIGNTARVGGDGQRVGPSSTPPHRHRAQRKWPKSQVRRGYPMSLGSPHERVNFLQSWRGQVFSRRCGTAPEWPAEPWPPLLRCRRRG
jgi:hypothetical protein